MTGSLPSAQAYLAAIVNGSDDAIIAKDLDGIIQWCNPAAERLFGYAAEELVGRSVRILIPPDLQFEEDEILARMRRSERIEHYETIRLTKDGRLIDISLTVSPVLDEAGNIIGISKTARDITERKRAAAELAAQQEWFRVTLESIGDAVIASTPDGRVTYLNRTAERLTGWKQSEAEGRPLTEVFSIFNEETGEPVDNPATRVMERGQVVGLANHTVLVTRDGTSYPVADSAAPIRDAKGRIIGVVLVFRDITDRRRAEQERTAAAAERERLLETERLARAEAEHANSARDDFIAVVSHELRTPLNAILGWTHLMMRNRDDANLLETGLDVVARNTRVQAQLISDLLDLSRIDSGKLLLEMQSVDLGAVVRDAVQAIQQEAAAAGIDIEEHVEPGLGPVAGDPARLQQVIWNLLSNALKFTPGGGRVSLRVQRVEGGVEIRVSDTGVGIPAHQLPRIFERFQQADRSSARRFGGLGLSIVRHLVELHGGRVRAESAGEGRGSTFVVRLPSGALPQQAKDGAPAAAAAGDHLSLRGLNVLVVEDEMDTRDFLAQLLEAHDADVRAVGSATEGLTAFEAHRPDVIVSDIGLPDMDGYDFMEAIRRKPAGAGGCVPAIALTAYGRQEDHTRALRAGYQAHVAKPVEPGEIIAIIGSLGGSARRQACG
jgi:PAS domain S-box-containing protein